MNRYVCIGLALIAVVVVLGKRAAVFPVRAAHKADAATEVAVLHEELPLPANGELSLTNTNGNITVSGWDESFVLVYAEKRARCRPSNRLRSRRAESSHARAQTALKDMNVAVTSDENTVRIETQLPNRSPGVELGVFYDLRVPVGTRVTITSLSGSVDVADVDGAVAVDTANGAVSCRRLGGSFTARTKNGSIDCANVRGQIDVDTVNGPVTIFQGGGGVQARSRNADITVDSSAGPVTAYTRNGAIAIHRPDIKPVPEQLYCESHNGAVIVDLPDHSAYGLEAIARNGVLVSDFPLEPLPAETRATVRLATTNGAVSVRGL